MRAAARDTADALEPLVVSLLAALGPAANATQPPQAEAAPDAARCLKAAESLAGLLSELDPSAEKFLDDNRTALLPLFDHERWRVFERLVRDYAFADAHAELENARARLPAQ